MKILENYLNRYFMKRSILENGFEGTSRSKTNALFLRK